MDDFAPDDLVLCLEAAKDKFPPFGSRGDKDGVYTVEEVAEGLLRLKELPQAGWVSSRRFTKIELEGEG